MSNVKFQRNYRLTVQGQDNSLPSDISGPSLPNPASSEIVITYPLTLEFEVMRAVSASYNTMSCRIYNLSEATRAFLQQDRYGFFKKGTGNQNYRRVTLEVGYGNNLTTVFQGNLFIAGSSREGVNIVTTLEACDGIIDTNLTNTFQTYQAGTSVSDLLKSLIGLFPNLSLGEIGDFPDVIKRPVSISGNVWRHVQLYSNGNSFIDLERVHVLGNNEVIESTIQLIDASTGLLGTPHRTDAGLSIETLLEPGIVMGQYINLQSTVMNIYNGKYKVCAVTHAGTISGAVGGECKSTFLLLLDNALFAAFKTVNNNNEVVDKE